MHSQKKSETGCTVSKDLRDRVTNLTFRPTTPCQTFRKRHFDKFELLVHKTDQVVLRKSCSCSILASDCETVRYL
jgi:hypothetical protein